MITHYATNLQLNIHGRPSQLTGLAISITSGLLRYNDNIK